MKNKFFENDFNCLVSDLKEHDDIIIIGQEPDNGGCLIVCYGLIYDRLTENAYYFSLNVFSDYEIQLEINIKTNKHTNRIDNLIIEFNNYSQNYNGYYYNGKINFVVATFMYYSYTANEIINLILNFIHKKEFLCFNEKLLNENINKSLICNQNIKKSRVHSYINENEENVFKEIDDDYEEIDSGYDELELDDYDDELELDDYEML